MPEHLARCIQTTLVLQRVPSKNGNPFLGVFNMKAKVHKKIYVENLLSRAS